MTVVTKNKNLPDLELYHRSLQVLNSYIAIAFLHAVTLNHVNICRENGGGQEWIVFFDIALYYFALLMALSMSAGDTSPTDLDTTWPFFMYSSVGTLIIWNRLAKSGSSSISTL